MTYSARRTLVLSLLSLTLLTNGCGILLPKQVEFFQRKVKAVPVYSGSAEELQRQGADRIAQQIQEAADAAHSENSSTNITAPLDGAGAVAGGLSTSLGPPAKPYSGSSAALAAKLKAARAKLDAAISDYAEAVDKDVGKKIEGTGLVRVGYFTMIGGLLLLAALVWFGLKVYGVFNPVVGGVTSVIGRVSSSVVSKGFTQLVRGGEKFKDAVENSDLDEKTAEYVKKLFLASHKEAQDSDVKKVVEGITQYPSDTVAPTAPPA